MAEPLIWKNAAGTELDLNETNPLPIGQGYALVDSKTSHGTATTPAAATLIASLTGLPAGVYAVTVYARYSGTPGAADVDNIAAFSGPTLVAVIPIDGAVGGPGAFTIPRVTLPATAAFNAVAIGAATAGAIYHATIVATQLMS